MITIESPAKVNLILKVLRRREDGYHDIASLMQKVSLADEMEFAPRKEGIALACPGSDLPTGEGNLVVRAARALFAEAGFTGGVDITLRKRIPTAAGLGGGSSNAATTLTVLNNLFQFGFDRERLIRIGARLGADVPFFILRQHGLGLRDRRDPRAGRAPARDVAGSRQSGIRGPHEMGLPEPEFAVDKDPFKVYYPYLFRGARSGCGPVQ